MISVKVLADSVSPAKTRMITVEATYPRFIHAQIMTHRALSKNTSSSRAIPAKAFRQAMLDSPAIPVHFGAAQKGMQADQQVANTADALDWWLEGMEQAAWHHARGEAMGLHKQILNRILEPYCLVTTIISGTEWNNFFALRVHGEHNKSSQHEIDQTARAILTAIDESTPTELKTGQWHAPLVSGDKKDPRYVNHTMLPDAEGYGPQLVSAARCARVSYMTHDKKIDVKADFELAKKLAQDGHWSPFEHVAMAMETDTAWGNVFGFKQLRKFFINENVGRQMT